MLQVPVRYPHNPKIIGKNRPGRKRYLKGWIRNHNVTQLSWILRHRYQTSAGRLLDQEPWAGGMAACVTEPTNCTCAVSEWTQSLSTNNGDQPSWSQPSWSWYQRQVAWIEAKNMSKETQVHPQILVTIPSVNVDRVGEYFLLRIASAQGLYVTPAENMVCAWYGHGTIMMNLLLAHYKSLWIWTDDGPIFGNLLKFCLWLRVSQTSQKQLVSHHLHLFQNDNFWVHDIAFLEYTNMI